MVMATKVFLPVFMRERGNEMLTFQSPAGVTGMGKFYSNTVVTGSNVTGIPVGAGAL